MLKLMKEWINDKFLAQENQPKEQKIAVAEGSDSKKDDGGDL